MGTWGRGDVGSRGREDAGTRGLGEVGREDVGTRRRVPDFCAELTVYKCKII